MPKYLTRFNPDDAIGAYPIKSAVVIAEGDLVGLDSNFQVVLADANGVVDAIGVASFQDTPGVTTRTGNAALTQKCTILPVAKVVDTSLNLTGGTRIYLSTTAGAVTQTPPTTANDIHQIIGWPLSATEYYVNCQPTALKYQAAATSTAQLR